MVLTGQHVTTRALLACLTVVVGCFDATVSSTTLLSCRDGADCPADLSCLTGPDARCVGGDTPCIVLAGRDATAVLDGTACGEASNARRSMRVTLAPVR